MGKFYTGVLFISTMAIACSTPSNKKLLKQTYQVPGNVETKTNISSSAAKADDRTDSAVIIRPVHKYKHQKMFKLK